MKLLSNRIVISTEQVKVSTRLLGVVSRVLMRGMHSEFTRRLRCLEPVPQMIIPAPTGTTSPI